MDAFGWCWMTLHLWLSYLISPYLIQQVCNNKNNGNMKNDDKRSLNKLPQDQHAILHSASPPHTVLFVSLCLTTPVE